MKKLSLSISLCGLFLSFAANLAAQTISTIAGDGTASFGGDGGAATAAHINMPSGLCFDATGNMYITDAGNQKIRAVSASGVITTIAGTGTSGFSGDGGPATAAKIDHPGDVAVAASGKIYFTDFNNNRVRQISGGVITTVAGTGAGASTGDGGPATAAAINSPLGIYLDASSGLMYVAALYDIRVINLSTGIIKTYAGTGSIGFGGDGGPATAAQFSNINFIYMDPSNNLYISDNGNQRIRKINSAGVINTIAGTGVVGFSGDGGPATNAKLNYPAGVIADNAGNVYVSDALNYRIRKISPSGIINTYSGTGSAGYGGDGGAALAALLNYPQDMEFNAAGNLCFADLINSRIRKIGGSNYTPVFVSQDIAISTCKNGGPTSLNSMLSIVDTNAGQTETWSILTNPSHGTLTGFPATMVSAGGATAIMPTGLSYTPTTGYVGPDAFSIKISDGQGADTVSIPVTITDCHLGVMEANEQHKNGLTIVPNPSSGSFNLFFESDLNEDVRVVVTDILGKKAAEFMMPANKNTSVTLSRPPGTYFITITAKDKFFSERVIIDK